jgi:heme/copper-type cytochrome/quinol oxidase subunit 1
MNKFWRAGLSLSITAFVSFWLFVYLFLYYDELHIKSTDYQLKDNLTHAQVVLDIAKTFLVTSALAAVVAACIYWLNKVEGIARSGKAAALACWCFMLAIILYLSVYHYRETSVRMENERQWRLQQQRR